MAGTSPEQTRNRAADLCYSLTRQPEPSALVPDETDCFNIGNVESRLPLRLNPARSVGTVTAALGKGICPSPMFENSSQPPSLSTIALRHPSRPWNRPASWTTFWRASTTPSVRSDSAVRTRSANPALSSICSSRSVLGTLQTAALSRWGRCKPQDVTVPGDETLQKRIGACRSVGGERPASYPVDSTRL